MKRHSRQHSAFTLVEVLVVVGIVGVLIAILIPSVVFALRAMARLKHESRINQIQLAMSDFKRKVNDYPKYVTGKTGAESLVDRLTKDQYIGMKKYKALLPSNHKFVGEFDDGGTTIKFFKDPKGHPILYYRAYTDWEDDSSGEVEIKDPELLWDDTKGVFRPKDNKALLDMLGYPVDQQPNLTEMTDPNSTEYGQLLSANILIIAAGIDGMFGTEDDIVQWEID